MITSPGFFDFNLSHVIELLVFGVAFLTYRSDRKKDARDREEARERMQGETIKMHTENRSKLDSLGKFHETQLEVNGRRDEQVQLLMTADATFAEMAKGFNRRLEMLEIRNAKRRS